MAVGAGLQGTVAVINLCCYYLVGIPLGAILGYVANLQVEVTRVIFIVKLFVTVRVQQSQLLNDAIYACVNRVYGLE